jgi:UDP-N-acetylglucosamine acyltransferase
MPNVIHPTALIGPNVTMGKDNYIGPYCIIGYPAEHKAFWGWVETEEGRSRVPILGKVEIGSNNVFTGHVTIDAGTTEATVIEDDCWFLKHSHVGHDSKIGWGVTLSCGAKVGGHSVIESHVNIGLNAVLHQRSFIKWGCMIGMGAVVTKTLETHPYSKYVGNPARYLGPNILPNGIHSPSDTK